MATIYIVCQEEKERLNYTQLLTSWGHNVTAVSDGWECADVLKIKKPDILLLEMGTTGLTSYEICKKIKDNPETFHIMVIILAKNMNIATRKHCYEVECDGIIPEPVDKEELNLLLNKLLHAHADISGTESRLQLLENLITLLQNLMPEVHPDDFSYVLSYAHSMILKMPYSPYQQKIILTAIKLCSYYIMIDNTDRIARSISTFMEGFVIGQWLHPSLLYVRYNSSSQQLSPAELSAKEQAKRELKGLGYYPLVQLTSMLVCLHLQKASCPNKLQAFAKLQAIAQEKDFDHEQMNELHQIILAENIFTKL